MKLVAFAFVLLCVRSYQCGGDRTDLNPPSSGGNRRLVSNILAPIRLKFYYMDEFDLGSTASNAYFKEAVMDSIDHYLAANLNVYSIVDPIVLPYSNCLSEVVIPDQHRTEGISDADVVVYITSINDRSKVYPASAGTCVAENDYAIAGSLVINSCYFNELNDEEKYSVIVHELSHIVGKKISKD